MPILAAPVIPADISAAADAAPGRFDPLYADEAMTVAAGTFGHFPVAAPAADEVWIHAALWRSAGSGVFMELLDAGRAVLNMEHGAGGTIRINALGGPFAASPWVTVSLSQLHVIDLRFRFAGAGMEADLHVDGGIAPAASVSTGVGSAGAPERLSVGGAGGAMSVSELVVSDEPTLGRRFALVRPSGAGAAADWTGGYAELGDLDPLSVAAADAPGQRVSGVVAWTPPAGASIERLALAGVGVRGAASGVAAAAPYLRLAGVDHDGPATPLAQTPTAFMAEWAINPATGLPWAAGDLSGAEIGLASS